MSSKPRISTWVSNLPMGSRRRSTERVSRIRNSVIWGHELVVLLLGQGVDGDGYIKIKICKTSVVTMIISLRWLYITGSKC